MVNNLGYRSYFESFGKNCVRDFVENLLFIYNVSCITVKKVKKNPTELINIEESEYTFRETKNVGFVTYRFVRKKEDLTLKLETIVI